MKTIKAKALRKKGTDEFYYWHPAADKWRSGGNYFPVYLGETKKSDFLTQLFPNDAELVEIEIIVKGGAE